MNITPSTHPDQLPFFLTVKQVAAWTGWSESTVKRKIHAEGLPAIPASDAPNSRQYRIPKEAFLRWVETAATSREKEDEFSSALKRMRRVK